MENYLVKLLVLAALLKFGITLSDVPKYLSHPTKGRALTQAIIGINWKPISLFHQEANRFKRH